MRLFGFGSRPKLAGRRIAILAAEGVEQVELTSPKKALEKAGATIEVVAPCKFKIRRIKAWSMTAWGESIGVDVPLSGAISSSYDGLHLPGVIINPDKLRTNAAAVEFIRSFFEAGKPVSSICHGPWLLIEAGAVRGRTLTSWPSIKEDLISAGANWVDQDVVEDRGLISGRCADDLSAFNKAIVRHFARAPMHVSQAA